MTPNTTFLYAPHGVGIPRLDPIKNLRPWFRIARAKLRKNDAETGRYLGNAAFRYCSPYAFSPGCASSERTFAVLTLGESSFGPRSYVPVLVLARTGMTDGSAAEKVIPSLHLESSGLGIGLPMKIVTDDFSWPM